MKKTPIILFGAGGHAKACIDVIESAKKFKIVGLLGLAKEKNKIVSGYKVIGTDLDLPRLIKKYKNFFVVVGQIKSAKNRIDIFNKLKDLGAKLPVIIASTAYVSCRACLDEGTIVMHKAIINAQACIGKNCIINTAGLIEHEVVIKDHCHVSTGAVINGQCVIGQESFIGSKSVLANNIHVCPKTIIGAGSVVVKDINDRGIYAGRPAKKISE